MAKKPLALDSFIASQAKLQITDSPAANEKQSEKTRAGAKKGKSPVEAQTPALPEQPPAIAAPAKRDNFKKKRIGQTVYLPPPVHRQLRALAFEEDEKRMHDYLMEGLDLVFRKRGLKSIAELTEAED